MKFFAIGIFCLLLALKCSSSDTKSDLHSKSPSVKDAVAGTIDTAYIHTVYFQSLDGLKITADLYHQKKGLPVMVLCHQAGYSRAEYQHTAVQFNKMGYNCLALDQRSGKAVNGVTNQTAERARKKGLGTTYLDAEQDISAGVAYAHKMYNKEIILLGSSYSASLVLKIAAENKKVSQVISFSPGEYFGAKLKITPIIRNLSKPTFLTSSKNEAAKVKKLFNAIPAQKKVQFTPSTSGVHGSRALWKATPGHKEYWQALTSFLE